MIFTEVPNADLFDKGRWWMPYAAKVAKREGDNPQDYIWEALRGEARIFVFWGKDGQPTGTIATRIRVSHDADRVGELHWIAGRDVLDTLPAWLPQLEQMFATEHNVRRIRLTGRVGWLRTLEPLGYRRAKVILEKGLENNA